MLVSGEDLARRRYELDALGGYDYPKSQTPWQEVYRATVGQMSTGACMDLATSYVDIAVKSREPRHSH